MDARPSQVTDVYWLHAKREAGDYPAYTKNIGKWLIFVDSAHVDEIWGRIKQATEEGKLGPAAKVSTAKPNPNARNPENRVICVYTYDWTDKEDVKRIRQELRDLGITRKIPYKADRETLSGKYAIRGDKRISKYFE